MQLTLTSFIFFKAALVSDFFLHRRISENMLPIKNSKEREEIVKKFTLPRQLLTI